MIRVYIYAWPEHYVVVGGGGGGGGGRHDFMALCVRLLFDCSTTWLSCSCGTGCLLCPYGTRCPLWLGYVGNL